MGLLSDTPVVKAGSLVRRCPVGQKYEVLLEIGMGESLLGAPKPVLGPDWLNGGELVQVSKRDVLPPLTLALSVMLGVTTSAVESSVGVKPVGETPLVSTNVSSSSHASKVSVAEAGYVPLIGISVDAASTAGNSVDEVLWLVLVSAMAARVTTAVVVSVIVVVSSVELKSSVCVNL